MKSPSHHSVPPTSSSPPPSSRGDEPGAFRYWHRLVVLGAVLAIGFSAVEVLVAASLRTLPSWQPVVLSLIFAATMVGLLMAGVGSLVAAAMQLLGTCPQRAMQAGAWSAAAVALAYAVFKFLALAFLWHGSSRLTVGSLEFLMGGIEHLAGPLLRRYPLEALGTVASGALVFWLARWQVVRQLPIKPNAVSLLLRSVVSLSVTAGLAMALAHPKVARGTELAAASELSLLSSIGERRAEEAEADEVDTFVPAGRRLETGKLWEASLSHEGPRPNVLLVMLESVSADHLSYRGYARPVTPNIDRLAKRSLRFNHAYATATHSNYAQMAVLSSLFPRRFSGLDVYQRLDYPRVLWHDVLAMLGYRTATYSSQNEAWQGMLRFQTTETPTEFHHAGTYDGQRIDMVTEKVVPDDVTTRRAISWMARQTGSFGLYVNLQSTHFPYRTPKQVARRWTPDRPNPSQFFYLRYPESQRQAAINKYDNALAFVDAQVGKLLQHLEDSGELENTIVVLTADHGELFLDHGMVTHGRSLYEGEARVPLLVSWPGSLDAGDVDAPVSTMDVLPTLLDLLDVMPHPAMQGSSLLEARDRPGDAARAAVFMNIQGMKTVEGIVCGNEKLIVDRTEGKTSFFDLSIDPDERRNLADAQPERVAELRRLLNNQMRAQMRYHSPSSPWQRQRAFAPRLANCPSELGGAISDSTHDTQSVSRL